MSNENKFAIVKNQYLLPTAKLDDQKYEFVFVLDRSGSMSRRLGSSRLSSIDLAREACVLFLRSLPVDCYFNIIGFGSNYETLFPNSVRYTKENLEKAVQYASGMEANMGGNEVELPLLHVYKSPGIAGYMTQMFVLTDGCQEFQTDRISKIVQIITNNKSRGRVFSLGIGDQASKELVARIAEKGHGTSDFVLENDTIRNKVLNQLKIALRSPLLVGIRVTENKPAKLLSHK